MIVGRRQDTESLMNERRTTAVAGFLGAYLTPSSNPYRHVDENHLLHTEKDSDG